MQVPGEYASDAVHLLREEGPAVGAGLQDEGSFLGAMLHSDRGEWINPLSIKELVVISYSEYNHLFAFVCEFKSCGRTLGNCSIK